MYSRHEIRQHAGSIDWPLWNNGTSRYIELLLSSVHVLVPNFHGYWYCVPLAVYANVSNSISHRFPSMPLHIFNCLNCFFSRNRSTMQGKTSHKFFDPNENFIMRLYYQKDVLTFMCFCNEMFYSGLYLLHFTTGPTCEFIQEKTKIIFLSL